MEWNPPSNASDTDVQPSLPHDTITNITGNDYVPCNASNDLLLRADNHTGYRLLWHIIRDPGSNHYNTPMGSISLSCNVHMGMIRNGTRSIRVSRAKAYQGKCLLDRGANGNICGGDVRSISFSDRTLNVTGIDEHEMRNLKIGTFGGVVSTQRGDVIAIFNQSAYHPGGKSILSCLQVEDNGITVHDKLIPHGGRQCIETPDGYIIPLDAHQGLVYMKIRPFTNEEFRRLNHVVFTRDIPWDPSRYDRSLSDDRTWISQQANPLPLHSGFDNGGNYTEGELYTSLAVHRAHLRPSLLSQLRGTLPGICDWNSEDSNTGINVHDLRMNAADYEAERIYFLNVPTDVVRRTRRATTQYYQNISSPQRMINWYKSPYPALNVFRRHEPVATDTVFADITAWGSGATCAQIYVGRHSRYIHVYGMSTASQFVNTLNDVIRKSGAMDRLTSDRAQVEVSKKVKDILRSFVIADWQSEPYQQQQNYSERIYQDVKKNTNWVLNWSGAPPQAWMWAFEYVVFIMNRTARESLNWRTPFEALFGQTPDVSVMMTFVFWELCYIKNYQGDGSNFPSESNEIPVRMIGFAEDVGHSCTYIVFNEETMKVLYRSALKKIQRGSDVNSRVLPPSDPPNPPRPSPDDPNIDQIVQSSPAQDDRPFSPGFDPTSLIGRSFLTNEEDGTRKLGEVIDYIADFEDALEGNPDRLRFKVKVGDKIFEEMLDYQNICDCVEDAVQNDDGTHNFRRVVGHRTKGSGTRKRIQLLVLWESGERTFEPMTTIYNADRYMVAEYAQEHGLLDEWEGLYPRFKLKRAASQSDRLMRFQAQVQRIKNNRAQVVYQYGHQVPRSHADAMRLDNINGNDKWAASERLEANQLLEYEAFIDLGHHSTGKKHITRLHEEGYKKISLHLVYAVKHDERYKSRIVAGGHLTGTPTESVYSGVVSLRGVRLVIFLAELNGLKVWQTDVGNAYLEAKTKEKVYVIAGPEFGELEGHIFVINKALYGLKTSGLRWHERFADVLRHMGFFPCRAEPDIWMKDCGTHYEYIAVYCDDLTIASMNPKAITDTLEHVHKFKLKGTGELNFLLGCDYFRDEDNTLCMAPKKYTIKMRDTFFRLFGENPKKFRSPLEPNDNPELDTSEFLEEKEIRIFQSLIGQAQWVIQLGRFDINVHVMTLSSFRMAPRQGHLERMKRIYGYCWTFKDATIRLRTGVPDFSDLVVPEVDWSKSPYAGAKEEKPSDAPSPRGKSVRLYTYADANLCHNKLNGKAVTAELHFINQTPFDWYSKLQPTVNTATYGAESTAARSAIEHMRANRSTLEYLGVKVIGPSILFGDNKTVVDGASHLSSKLHKRHLMLSYHYVREALATGEYVYSFINGKANPSDILSKHWSHNDVWPMLQAILFWRGDTMELARIREEKSSTNEKDNDSDGRGVTNDGNKSHI